MAVAIESIVPSSGDATDRFLVRRGAGPADHTMQLLTPASAKALLAITASDVSGLAAIATTPSAANLTSGILPAARFDDTSHGNRGGGSLHPLVTAAGAAGFMSGADKTKLDGIAAGAQVNVPTNLSYDASTRVIASDTGADATLPLADTTNPGLAPARSGVATQYLDGTGAYSTPAGGGGGSPGGVSGEIQFNNAGAFGGAADVEIEGGQLRLPSIATPTAPAANGLKLFAQAIAGQQVPTFKLPSAEGQANFFFQRMLCEGSNLYFIPAGGTTVTALGAATTATGTATAANVTNGTRRQRLKRIEYLVTVAATTAVAGWFHNASQHTVGGANAWEGGFSFVMFGGPATGVATATHRFFMGMRDTGAPSDVDPGTFLRCVGIGYARGTDANLQFMHNDAAGVCTKINLGASFAVPTTDRAVIWRLRMFSPPGTTQSVTYEVTNLDSGAQATGTVNTNLPSTTEFITPRIQASVGGTSSVIGVAVGPCQVEVEQ